MSIFDKMFGHEEKPKQEPQYQAPQPPPVQNYGQPPQPQYGAPPPPMSDDQAIARYKYMLKTAPPETIEQAHQEAFAQLTPQQRQQVLQQLNSQLPPDQRPPMNYPGADDPQNLARMATRAEVRQPGTMERIFGSQAAGTGPGMGAVIGGSLLTSLAGGFIGSAIADHFFNNTHAGQGFFGGGGGFGGGFGGPGGNFGGPQVVNNYYGGGGPGQGQYRGADNEVSDNADDASYDASSDSADNQSDDEADNETYDGQPDDNESDDQSDASSYDSGSDDGGGSDNSSDDN